VRSSVSLHAISSMGTEQGAADPGSMRPASRPRGAAHGTLRRVTPRLLPPHLLLAVLLVGCAGARPALGPVTAGSGAPAVSGPGAPWTISGDAYPSQTLFRMEAETADGEANVRMVLRLERPDRYRLTVSDRLGRTLYTVDVGASGGWLADHRSRKACPIGGGGDALVLRGAPFEGFSTAALPAVLLGRVPAEPAGPVIEGEPGELVFRDRRGRRWSVRSAGEDVLAWTLWQGDRPVLWWRRDGERVLLSDRLRGAQLRWQTVAREPLPAGLSEPALPDGFEAAECREEEPVPFDSPQSGL